MSLIDAIVFHDVQSVKRLLEQGVDPNVTLDWAGVTPMHFAVLENMPEIAELLFTAGADLDSETCEGETPLSVAQELQRKDMARLLEGLKCQVSY